MTKLQVIRLAAVVVVSLLAHRAVADTPAPPPTKAAVTSPASKTIILIHGAFADGSSWDKVVPILQAKGYNVIALHQPLTSLADDVAAAKRTIDAQTGEVILVAHSYGGMIMTEAGNNPKVSALVYVAAFGPDDNESINVMGKGAPPMEWVSTLKVDSGGYGSLPTESVEKYFAVGLPAKEAKVIAAKQGPVPVKTFDDKVKTAAWKTKRSWYVRAEQDQIINPAGQEQMAKRMKAKTTSLKSGHLAMLVKPQEVAKVILEAATAPAETAMK